jgi:hypothetical protein
MDHTDDGHGAREFAANTNLLISSTAERRPSRFTVSVRALGTLRTRSGTCSGRKRSTTHQAV